VWVGVQQAALLWVCVCVGIVWLWVKGIKWLMFLEAFFVSWSFIGIFVIYDANYNINISEYSKDPFILSIIIEILTGFVK